MTRLPWERRIVALALAALLPLAATALLLVFIGDFSLRARVTVGVIVAVSLVLATAVLHERLVTPLRTLSSLIGALREGDHSLRGRRAEATHAMGEVLAEINALADLLQDRHHQTIAATTLVREVLAVIDDAIIVVDEEHRIRLLNPSAERLLDGPAERLTGRSAHDLGLDPLLDADEDLVIEHPFPAARGRWSVRSRRLRDRGREHRLLVVTDLSRTLREEERLAWQRLVRVLGHEINNSLAPIRSIAGSLRSLVSRQPLPDDWKEDVVQGLGVVESRTDALTRFTEAYAKLARLPAPRVGTLPLLPIVERAASVAGAAIDLDVPATLLIDADPDQLEQLLINLLKNAVEATGEEASVAVSARRIAESVEISIRDEGPGLPESANLFVPFFTTKPGGSGIGLVLARQIAEGHGGSLELRNRAAQRGAEAVVRLPVGGLGHQRSGSSSQVSPRAESGLEES